MANNINYTYVYYNVVDYTGNSVLSSFTLGNTPLTFIPDFSTSPILSGAQSISNKLCHWDFGDGSTSDTISPTHNYQWPGLYNVTLTIFDAAGNAYDSTYQSTITVYDYISTQITFQDYKSFVYDIPAGRLIDPFTLNTNFSWQNYQTLTATGVTINLYASGAHGDYNYVADTLKDKWVHLRSLSRFYTLSTVGSTPDYLEIDSISPSLTAVYVNIQNNQIKQCKATDSGATLAGAIGNCQFWYTDDRPANLTTESSPIILFATLDNSKLEDAFTQRTNAYEYISYPPYGYQNIEPAVYASIKTRFNPANRLSITTTGIDGEGALSASNFSIPYISWQNTEIPYVVKFKDAFNYTTKNYPPLSSSQITGTTPQSAYDLQVGIVSVSGNNYTSLGQVSFYQDFPQQAPQSLGAFYKGYFIPQQSSLNCALTAAVTVVEPAYYQKDALVGWIAIPQYNSAFRILRQTQINGFTDATTVSFTNNSNPLFSLGNNQNVYAMCVATSGSGSGNDYQTWFADPVNDVIVKYDLYGNPLPVFVDGNNITQYSFTLSAMPVLTNNLITYTNDFRTSSTLGDGVSSHAAPNGIAMDSNSDIWVTLLDSGSAIKINTSRGVVTTVAAPAGIFNYAYTLSSYYSILSGFAGENLLMPTSLDTDIQNNLWVSYDHPAYSALVKYQGVGNFTTTATTLTSVLFPTGISPEEICIDRNQSIWVTATNHNVRTALSSTNGNGILYKFDTNGNLLSTITGFSTLGNLTIDGNQNAWVTQGTETLVKVDGLLGTKSYYLAGKGNNKTEYINSIGGITCDTANHIWVINNFDKNLYIIDANTPATTPPFLNPLYTIPLTYPTTGLSAVSYSNYDADYTSYITLAGVTDYVAQNQIYQFIQGVKNLGLWNNMICWPMISTQNASKSSTIYSLGGLSSLNGSLQSGVWSTSGLSVSGSSNNTNGNAPYVPDPGYATAKSIFNFAVGQFPNATNTSLNQSLMMQYPSRAAWISPNSGFGNYESQILTSGGTSAPVNISTAYNSYATIGSVGLSAIGYKNNTQAVVDPTNISLAGYTSTPIALGSYSASAPINCVGYIPFAAVFLSPLTGTFTTATLSAINSLYASTLGSGLSGFGKSFPNNINATPPPITPAVNTYSDGLQEFQAIGDWNGYRWLNKYAAPISTIRTITGASSLFNIYPSSGQYNISKINEGWDASGYYSSLRYQESLLDKDVFFKQFLGVILGDLNAQPYELGKTVYEKIANFVDNNSDIDKVNISELISFCEELSIDFAQYNYVLPPQIRRLMDLLSIKQSILWGNSNKYTLNFNPQGTMFHNNTYGINLSSAIDPLTGTFISGTPIIAQEVFSGNYILVNTNFISGSGTVIPLSAYTPSWGWGLVVPNSSTGTAINNYYKFYNFNPQFDGTYYDNIINWTNPLTTLTPTNSSYSNWSGDNGIIQNMLSYEMTKGFKLFTSAAKITYNS
jgi:streptogramin lyase